ncbi:MAG: protein kinase [Aggregatilineales bacterium]
MVENNMMPSENSVGTVSKRYILHDLIGQGGMGSVYRAQDRLTGKTVALKRVLSPSEVIDFSTSYDSNDFRLGLAQEFKLLASLRHPNIIEVLDYGFDDDQQPYFTMELLENAETIVDATKDQSLETLIDYLVQMLQALSYLHYRDILHRDLKPANVLVINGQVKVLDFGLSAMREHLNHEANDEDTSTAGTITYMAPEIMMGHSATEQSDLYAVGMIAFEIIAGAHPFGSEDVASIINHVLYTTPDTESLDIAPEVAGILATLLDKEPANRYSSARKVLEAIDTAVESVEITDSIEIRESFLQAAKLVGRDDELSTLTSALKNATNENGSTWLVAGESGVGKSRLLDELRTLALVDGALVMRGQSVEEGSTPYMIWRVILRWLALLADISDSDASIIKLLAPELTGVQDPSLTTNGGFEPGKVQERLVELINRVIREQERPLVILLEDLHWAGQESLTLLRQVTQLAEELPLLVVGSYRDDEFSHVQDTLPDVPILKLNRLHERDIAQLSQAMLGDVGAQPQIVNLLQRETEGNVFFLIEVVRALAEEAGDLSQIGMMTLPQDVFAGGVRLIIQRRLQRLPDWTQKMLRYAAILGRYQDVDVLNILDSETDASQWLIECVNAAVLEIQDGEWRFTHDKLRDAVLADVPDDQKMTMHHQVAEEIEARYGSESRPALLAYHWGRAGDREKESHFVIIAGRQALRTGAYEESITSFERAVRLLDINFADDSYDTELRSRQITLQNYQAEAYLGMGQYEQAQLLYRNSLLIAEQIHTPLLMANSLSALADVHYVLNTPGKAREYYQESLVLYREVDDKAGIARVLHSLGNLAYDQGDHNIAKQLYQQSMNISREIGGQWGMAGSVSSVDANSEISNEQLTQKNRLLTELETLTRNGEQKTIANKLTELGEIAVDMKTYDDANEFFGRALAIKRELADMQGIVDLHNKIGSVSIQMGNFTNASKHLRRALQKASDTDRKDDLLKTLMNVVHLRVAEDKKEHALELLAFLFYYPDSSDDIEDEAERILFDIESELSSDVVQPIWEKGKESTLDDILRQTLSLS